MGVERRSVNQERFNPKAVLPYELRLLDFEAAMQDVYDFFADVNGFLTTKGLGRLEDTLRKAILSGVLSDMLTASLASHSRTLVQNRRPNGHPDLLVQGVYPDDAVKAGSQGVEIKTTVKKGGAVDTHGARDQWFCVFVYRIDNVTEPASDREPLRFTEVYLAEVTTADFPRNERGELGTRTATTMTIATKQAKTRVTSEANSVRALRPCMLREWRSCVRAGSISTVPRTRARRARSRAAWEWPMLRAGHR